MHSRITNVKNLQPQNLGQQLIDRWNEIIRVNPDLHSPFFAYEYTLAAANAGLDVWVCVMETDSRVVAFFPFQYKSRLLRTLGVAERVSGDLSDYSGIIAEPDFSISWPALLKHSQLNFFEISHFDEGQARFGLDGESPVPSPVLDFSLSSEPANSKERRKKVHFLKETERRINKTIEDLGEIRFEFDCAEPGAELNRCIETKRQQYSRTDVRDPLDSVAARSLLTNLVNTESSRCRGIVSTLYAGEHWLATHMGMINEDVMHYWFPVYNPELVDYSPGRILIVKMIEHAQHLGTRSFDFGAGESQMKRKFSNTHRMVLKGEARIRHINTMIYKVSLSSKWYFNAFRRKLFS